MIEYPHIDSVFKRHMDGPDKGKLIDGAWTCPEFEYLAPCKWVGTEKVNGTNIRVIWWPTDDHGPYLQFRGKTDRAQPMPELWKRLGEIFTVELMSQVFPDKDICLYGEGYGHKINSGGLYLPNKTVDFCLFDIRVGDWWLKYSDCAMIAERMNIKIVPVVGEFTLYEAIDYVKRGFVSSWAEWGTTNIFLAEGLVLKPHYDFRFRNGQRIVTKMKTKDWQ